VTAAEAVAGVGVLSLGLYALLGGADFGGGVWDLLARGPRAARQRALIDEAIAPVWEANHVWLILVVVLLFAGFPPAFAAISTALHVPLTLVLLGVVLRGAAWVFRRYGEAGPARDRWGRVFAVASTITPVFLGVALGAVTSGAVRLGEDGAPVGGFFAPWLRPFPFAVGAFVLALFAYLAAVYLAVEAADEPALADDFRRRALAAGLASGGLAWLTVLTAGPGTGRFAEGLLGSAWSWPLQLAVAALAVAALVALWRRRFRLARALAVGQVAGVVLGWGLAMHPHVVPPDLTIASAAAPPATQRGLLVALGAGGAAVFPALYWLLRVFKSGPARGGSSTA